MQPEQVGEAHAAMRLGRHARDVTADIAEMRLGLQRGQSRLVRQRVLRVASVPNHGAARLQYGDHVGKLMLHRLEAADQAVELRALLHECQRLIEHMLCCAQRVGRQHDATGIQHPVHCRERRIRRIEHDCWGVVEAQVGDRSCAIDAAMHGHRDA